MNGEPSVPQDSASRGFTQLGLLVGSCMLWEEDRDVAQSQQLENLMRWALNLPPVLVGDENYYPHLGVSAQGLALIYYTILQDKKRKETLSKAQEADEETLITVFPRLRNSSVSIQQDMADLHDYRHFEPHIDEFSKYVKCLSKDMETAGRRHRAAAPRMYIWLDRYDIDWWVTSTRKTLDDYFRLIREDALTLEDVSRRCVWLKCSVFAPLDISQRLPTLGLTAVDGMPLDEVMRERSADLAEEVYELARVYHAQRESRYLYLSWDLVAFGYWKDDWREQLIHRTMLSLWTAWPRDMVWAPMPPVGFSSPATSFEDATCLLNDLLRPLRRYFLQIKDAHQLSLTKLEFEKTGGRQTHYPPTFYFADPICRLPRADAYADNTDVHHLINSCIEYDDPHADTLSWSSLEGSIVSIRGETTQMDRYKARYLLLPIEARPDNDKAIGLDLDYIVDLLTFLEYTIGLEAEDIYKRAKDIESKRATESYTINTRDYISRKLANIVSALPGEALKSGAEEFAELQLLLGRVQYALEKMRGDAVQLERQFDFLVNRTNEFLRENLIKAPVSNLLHFSAGLMDTYPYRSLQSPMRYIPVYTTQLANSSERVGSLLALLSTAIRNNERRQSERLDRRGKGFLAILAVVALLVALPTFFPDANAQAIFKLFGHEPIYTSNRGIFALVMFALAFLAFILWFCVQIWRRRTADSESRQERDRFRKDVKQFWDLADHTTYMYEAERRRKEGLPQLPPALHPPPPNWFEKEWDSGRGVDNIDSQATTILQELWQYLDSPSQEASTNMQRASSDDKQQASKDMIAQVRILRNLIHVFVLRPDLIPLPRALCILRYKSLQFLENPAIGDIEFRDSLVGAGFTLDHVKLLQHWLSDPENQEQFRSNSVSVAMVAQALKNAGITAPPPKDVVNRWHGNLFSQAT